MPEENSILQKPSMCVFDYSILHLSPTVSYNPLIIKIFSRSILSSLQFAYPIQMTVLSLFFAPQYM